MGQGVCYPVMFYSLIHNALFLMPISEKCVPFPVFQLQVPLHFKDITSISKIIGVFQLISIGKTYLYL